MKRWKDAAEAKAERKRKRKAKHDKACKIARSEGKPRPATPESTDVEEEEEASNAEGHLLGDDGAAAGASSPPTYQWDADEGAPAGAESSMLAASSHQADTRGVLSGQSSRGGVMPRARRTATRKWSMRSRSG